MFDEDRDAYTEISHWNAITVPRIAHVPDAIARQATQRQERRQRVRSNSMGTGNTLSEKDLRDLHSLWSVYRDRAASTSDVHSSSLQHSKVRVVRCGEGVHMDEPYWWVSRAEDDEDEDGVARVCSMGASASKLGARVSGRASALLGCLAQPGTSPTVAPATAPLMTISDAPLFDTTPGPPNLVHAGEAAGGRAADGGQPVGEHAADLAQRDECARHAVRRHRYAHCHRDGVHDGSAGKKTTPGVTASLCRMFGQELWEGVGQQWDSQVGFHSQGTKRIFETVRSAREKANLRIHVVTWLFLV